MLMYVARTLSELQLDFNLLLYYLKKENITNNKETPVAADVSCHTTTARKAVAQ
jgi:hypothetical protein